MELCSVGLSAVSLTLASFGFVSLRLLSDCADCSVPLSSLWYLMLAVGCRTRYWPLVSVFAIVAHLAYLFFFAATELTIRLSDSTQQNPYCSPDCVPSNSLFNDENWLLLRGSVFVSALQVVGHATLLFLWPDDNEKDLSNKTKID
jgi:hypothetical protein